MNMQQMTPSKRRIIVAAILLALLASTLAGAIYSYATFNIDGVKPVSENTSTGKNWRDNYNGIFSSWDAPKQGFRVAAGYGNMPEVPKPSKNSSVPEFYTEAIGKTISMAKLQQINENTGYFDKHKAADWYAYDIKANTKGKVGIWLRNLQIFDNEVGEKVMLDCKVTITDWEDETQNTPQKHHFTINRTGAFPCFDLSGIKEIRFKNEYFYAGTSKPYQMKSSITFNDVDSKQYIAYTTNQIVHQYLDRDTALSFKKDAGYYAYQDPDIGDDSAMDPRQAVGVDFHTSSLEFIYGTKNDSGGTYYFGQLGYRMSDVEINTPTKTISDSDEEDQKSALLGDRNETITYKVNHTIANGYSPSIYFKGYRMEDTLEDCLQILSAKVVQDGEDASPLFDVKTNGQTVTAIAKANAISKADFYGKTYQLVIEAKLKDGITDAELAPWMNGEILKIPNVGSVTVTRWDDEEERLETKPVTAMTWEAAPEKTVSDADETDVKANTIASRLESYTYKIKQFIPEDGAGDGLKKLEFSDEIEECMEIQDVKIYEDDAEVSRRWNIQIDGNKVVASDPNPGEKNLGKTYTLEITVRVKYVNDTVLSIHGHFNSDKSALRFQNRGNVTYQIAGGEEISCNTNPVTTTVKLPVDMGITKTVDRYEHQVGDPIHYTVKIGHNTADCDATDVVVRDTDLENFDLDVKNSKVTGVTDYTIEPVSGGWEFTTPKLAAGQQVQIDFVAKAKKILNGTIPENTASVKCYGVPTKYDSEEVYINSPKMKIVKSSERVQYAVGQNIDYTLEISQINTGCFMRDVILKDTIQTEGVNILPGSLIVLDKNGKDVTSTMDVTIDNQTFTIKTKRNFSDSTETILPKERKITPYNTVDLTGYLKVCYTAKIADNALFDKAVQNLAEAPSRPNTNNEIIKDDPAIPSGGTTTEHVVPVAGAELRITKDSNKDKYEVGETGIYTIRIEQIRQDYVAKEVCLKDDFQNPGMEIDPTSIIVRYEREDITDQCSFTYHDKTGYTIKTGQDLSYGQTIDVTYRAKFASEDLVGQDIRNVAVASSKTADEKETDHIVAVGEWTAWLNIEKTSDKDEYEVTDTVHYTLKTTNTSPNTAEQVVVSDEMQQKGIEVIPDSIKVYYDSKGNVKDITDACEINTAKDHFDIKTFRNLPRDNVIKVTYDATITDKALANKQIKNIAMADAKNTDQVETPHEVPVLPLLHLDIEKKTDQDLYRITDQIHYTITASNPNKRAAKNVVITDGIQTEGMELLPDTIKVFDPDHKDITEECKITAEGNQFQIATGKNLNQKKAMTVTYTANILDPGLAGKQVDNVATTTADNVDDTDTDHTVPIEALAVLEIQKESEKTIYNFLEPITYHLTITNTSQPTALNVVIEDTVKTEGIRILPDTIEVTGPDGVDMTQSCKVTAEGNQLLIETGKYLKAGEQMRVTYQVENNIRELADGQVENRAVTKADNSDPDEDEHIVPIEPLAELALKKVSDQGTYRYDEDLLYRLQVTNISDPVAIHVKIEDTVKTEGLTLLPETIQVKGADGANITKECKITTDGNHFLIATGKNLSRNEQMEVSYLVKNGNPELAGKQVDNAAITEADNSDPVEKEHMVPIEEIAKLHITKTSDKKQYHLNEDVAYTIKVKAISDTAAQNVVISDTIQTKGLKLVKDSIKVLDPAKKDLTDRCDITTTDTGFTIATGKSLSKNQVMTVTYRVHIPDTMPSLVGKDLKNVAITTADNTDQTEPITADHEVPIDKYAELEITKQADQQEYKVGDSIGYTLKVKNVSDLEAKNIVIKDKLKTDGAVLNTDSIRVIDPEGKDITKSCTIKATETGFTIKTGRNLAKDQAMAVKYTVKVGKELSGKKLENIASASADNTLDASDKNMANPCVAKSNVKVVPQTGYHTPLWPITAVLLLSGLALVGYGAARRKKD